MYVEIIWMSIANSCWGFGTHSISTAWTLDQAINPCWSFLTEFQTPKQFLPFFLAMARRQCRRPAGGIGKVQQHSPHCCTYQPTPAEELELIFHIHGRADGQQWNENANAKGNCVLCGAMRFNSPLWPSLSGLSDRQRISRKVNHEVGPQGRRNVENCVGDNIQIYQPYSNQESRLWPNSSACPHHNFWHSGGPGCPTSLFGIKIHSLYRTAGMRMYGDNCTCPHISFDRILFLWL